MPTTKPARHQRVKMSIELRMYGFSADARLHRGVAPDKSNRPVESLQSEEKNSFAGCRPGFTMRNLRMQFPMISQCH